jgi:5-methylcytosine-specific restriction endonuclease McrA
MRVCSQCQRQTDNFTVANHWCRDCQNSRRRQRYATDVVYRAKTGEASRRRKREYYWADPEAARAKTSERHRQNPDKAARAVARRRARLHNAFVEDVDFAATCALARWICGIGGGKVEKADASQDHVIPLAKGGKHEASNVQLAHLLCNIRKGARIAA